MAHKHNKSLIRRKEEDNSKGKGSMLGEFILPGTRRQLLVAKRGWDSSVAGGNLKTSN